MAKVKITGHASGTGILTVTAPNTSTDRTITLPDATGTLLNSDGSGASLTALNATQLTSGTVPTARLGSGSASSSVFLSGANTWISAADATKLPLAGGTMTGALVVTAASGITVNNNASSNTDPSLILTGASNASQDSYIQMGAMFTSNPVAMGMDNSSNSFIIARNSSGNLSSGEHVVINSSGNVGIGEAAPANKLEIRAATTVTTKSGHLMLTSTSGTNGNGPQIVFSESGSNASYAGGSIGFIRTGSNGVGDLVLGTRASTGDANTATTEQLKITSDGRGVSQFTAKGWVNFDGTGTLNVRDSHNVSSVADNGTGNYTLNWDVDMANANYAVTVGSQATASNQIHDSFAAQDTANVVIDHHEGGTPSSTDCQKIMVIGFGD